MRGLRLKFMLALYNGSSRIYAELFKANKKAWGIKKEDFLLYPKGSLGFELGVFYQSKGFDVMPKLENHDVFHVISGIGTEIRDEIAMQYLLFGNGKSSLYLLAMLFIGTFVFPEHFRLYRQSYLQGKQMARFFDLEFKDHLENQVYEIQSSILHNQELIRIKN